MADKKQAECQEIHERQGKDRDSLAWGFAEHLRFTFGVDRFSATTHDKFLALAYAVRDRLINQWIKTQQTHHNLDVKRVYYLSLEFLMGRALGNNVINICMEDAVRNALKELGYDFDEIREEEVDAGLGNGGLGRLAACFMDSLATLEIPAFGYGLRYDYGIFRQEIQHGHQVEQPDEWLRKGNPWEIERPDMAVPVQFGGRVEMLFDKERLTPHWVDAQIIMGIPYDTPVVGYGGKTVNTLRLWSAKAASEFDLEDFNRGDYVDAVDEKVKAENITKVLYPNDRLYAGKELRLRQQYFFVACSLADAFRRFKKSGKPWKEFSNLAAIQLNDTHPAIAVAELMRLLIDTAQVDWDSAWDITVKTLGYTNHTLMPEALERWPVSLFEYLLPRHLQIIYEINYRFLQNISLLYPGNREKLRSMSIIEEGEVKQIRMAYLSIVGSHSINGVAELHTELLKKRLVPEFAEVFPERFNNKTNGITQRRWLLKSNPALSKLITDTIGDGWITDLAQLKKLKKFAEDSSFREKYRKTKFTAKEKFADFAKKEWGFSIDPESLFDVQIKRIHQYKRQLLNVMHIVLLYNRIRTKGMSADFVPRTFLFGGKAAPGYAIAKLYIKLIGNVSQVINSDPHCKNKLKVFFLPNYRVSLAERIFPAADLSEQISLAGTEASGTGNMKFMLNGALTIGTLDGANIEIAEEAGIENEFIFGLTADEVSALRPSYNAWQYYENDAEIKETMDLLFSGCFNIHEQGIYDMIHKSLFQNNDYYMHFPDLPSYAEAQQKASDLYRDKDAWSRKAIINIASSGKFSSDRTILEYARDVWHAKPCPVEMQANAADALEEAKNT